MRRKALNESVRAAGSALTLCPLSLSQILSHSLVLLTNLVSLRPRTDWSVHVTLILNNVMFLLQSCLSVSLLQPLSAAFVSEKRQSSALLRLQTGQRAKLALHALLFLHTIAQHSEEAQLLASYDLPCLLNFASDLSLAPEPSAAEEKLPTWCEVVVLVVRLFSGLLTTLGRPFFPKAAAFFGAQWWRVLAPPLQRCLRSLATPDLILGEAVLHLVWCLALHRQLWHLHLPSQLLEGLAATVHSTAHRCTALMQAPKWLHHQLEAKAGPAGAKAPPVAATAEAAKTATPHRVRHRQRSRSSSRTSSCGPEAEESAQPRVRRVEAWLFRLLMVALSAFNRIAPRIAELVGQPLSELEELELMVRPSFSSPGLQEEAVRVSMGVLIAVLHLTVKQLSKVSAMGPLSLPAAITPAVSCRSTRAPRLRRRLCHSRMRGSSAGEPQRACLSDNLCLKGPSLAVLQVDGDAMSGRGVGAADEPGSDHVE